MSITDYCLQGLHNNIILTAMMRDYVNIADYSIFGIHAWVRNIIIFGTKI